MQKFVTVVFVVLIIAYSAMNAHCQGLAMWLSDSGATDGSSGQGVPDLTVGGSNSIYLWGRPDAGKDLDVFGLNIRTATAGVIAFTNIVIDNPLLASGSPDTFRFEFTNDSNNGITVNSESINSFGALILNQESVNAEGIGPTAIGLGDSFYDAGIDAFRLATINYNVVGGAGSTTDLYLQMSSLGILHAGETTADANIVLGAATDPALNGATDREIDSLTRDAKITAGAGGIPGDFDNDTDVDGADFLKWQRNTAVGNLADWETNFGTTTGVAITSAVPEPSALLLSLIGMFHIASRRRRNRA